MAKYTLVDKKKVPGELSNEEYVIDFPNFIAEVKACSGKKPRNGLLSPNYMREIAAFIGDKYLDEDFNTLVHVNVSRYRGIPIENDEQVAEVAAKMMVKSVPGILDKYVDYHIKQRPRGCKLIYFLGDHLHTNSFTANGIDEVKYKDVDVYMGKKKKKIVGKPAVSNS